MDRLVIDHLMKERKEESKEAREEGRLNHIISSFTHRNSLRSNVKYAFY